MALNPQLASPHGPLGSPFPAPYQSEYICAGRDGVHFDIDGLPRGSRLSASGAIYLTNFRLVFVPAKPTAQGAHAVELPLLYISKEDVKQPIFGSNCLCGVVRPVEAPPNSSEEAVWKLSFTNGGMGTLVPLFYAALQYLRVASRRAQERGDEGAPGGAAPAPGGAAPPPFVQTALVDANDPTRVYLTQQVPTSQPPDPPKFPVA